MRCLLVGIGFILFAVTLLLSRFLPDGVIIFIQSISLIAAGFLLLRK